MPGRARGAYWAFTQSRGKAAEAEVEGLWRRLGPVSPLKAGGSRPGPNPTTLVVSVPPSLPKTPQNGVPRGGARARGGEVRPGPRRPRAESRQFVCSWRPPLSTCPVPCFPKAQRCDPSERPGGVSAVCAVCAAPGRWTPPRTGH